MKPKKKESKQSFLTRCTAELTKTGELSQDEAFTQCNMMWSETNGKRKLTLAAPIKAELAPEDPDEPGSFLITAYTGALMQRFYRPLILDIKGMKALNQIPVLREHERNKVVGYSSKAWSDKSGFYISGDFSKATETALEVEKLAKEGFPWQASVGVWADKIKLLEEKESMKVNGQTVEGPAEIWLESRVRETSFVALGADEDTAAITLSMDYEDDGYPNPTYLTTYTGGSNQEKKEIEEMEFTLDVLTKEAPELLKQIQDEATANGLEAGKKEGLAEGTEAERKRVTEILAVEDADPSAVRKAIREGLDVNAAFKLFYEAEKTVKANEHEKLKASLDKNVATPEGKEKGSKSEAKDFSAMVDEYQRTAKCSRLEALKAVANANPALHAEYIRKHNEERDKVKTVK